MFFYREPIHWVIIFIKNFPFSFYCIDENIKYNFVILYISESTISSIVDYFDPNHCVNKCMSALGGRQFTLKCKLKHKTITIHYLIFLVTLEVVSNYIII